MGFKPISTRNFNPRTYVRCDAVVAAGVPLAKAFQSTHLREVRRHIFQFLRAGARFQSTHLREVRLSLNPLFGIFSKFQSTHLREVRLELHVDLRSKCLYFNPRTYVRCDYLAGNLACCLHHFNPRTYVRCDLIFSSFWIVVGYFNPRTYVRCDRFAVVGLPATNEFQSTHLREVRQLILHRIHQYQNFNPRTYVRCDNSWN